MQTIPPPSRDTALRKLHAFLPKAGQNYARLRNFDLPGHPHVSGLSPYLRHRLITEAEVLAAVLGRTPLREAEKFVQEVFWRTYWKGWLEMRPSVWSDYLRDLNGVLNRVQTESGLRRGWEAACRGETGIEGFDGWAHELIETGYLHNHARMWFASIWIFTLELPWELGADFFLRHLLDGDPASNTLGWRWVGGLQTVGKTYLARPDNIARYTEGRVQPTGLAETAPPLPAGPTPPRLAPPSSDSWQTSPATGLLITEDDLSPDFLLEAGVQPQATAALLGHTGRSPLKIAPMVEAFTLGAAADMGRRLGDRLGALSEPATNAAEIVAWAKEAGLTQVVMPYAPVGPAATQATEAARLLADEGVALYRTLRPYDAAAWPHATHGFFRFKEKIPTLIDTLGLRVAA